MKNSKNSKFKRILCSTLAASMLLSLAACDDKAKKGNKSDSNELVTEAAEDFTDALTDMDFKKLVKFSTELDDSTTKEAQKLFDKNEEIGAAMLKSVKFTIDEDSAEEDKDSGSIVVKYQYVDVEDLDTTDINKLLKQISTTDEVKSGKVKIEFDIDDDEALVSNADKTVSKFYDDVLSDAMKDLDLAADIDGSGISLDINIDDYFDDIDYENLDMYFYVSTEEFEYSTKDTIDCVVSTYSDKDDISKEATVSFNDFDGKTLWTTKITLEANKEITFSIKPSDLGLKEFAADWYDIVVTFEEDDYSASTFVVIDDSKGSSSSPNSGSVIDDDDTDVVTDVTDNKITTGDGNIVIKPVVGEDDYDGSQIGDGSSSVSDFEFKNTSVDKFGYMEGTVYTNEFFGFSIDLGEESICRDNSMMEGIPEAPDGLLYDEITYNPDNGRVVMILLADIDTDIEGADELILKVKPGSGDSKATYNGVNFLVNPTGKLYMTAKDNTVMLISFESDIGDEDFIDSVLSTIKCM